MKTITIQSKYETLFVAYQIVAITKKGETNFGCPHLNKATIMKWQQDEKEKVPYYNKTLDTIIYDTYVREITIIAD